jgi:glycosyltransferase involved in cell wall biosynthesis
MTVKQKDTAILITAHNEARAIRELLAQIPEKYQVYLVDDASTDDTTSIAGELGAKIISLPIRLGQGAASIVGFRLIAEARYAYIVKMDGDGQHDPDEIPKFVDALTTSDIDVVGGSRILGSNYEGAPLARRVFLRPVTWLLNRITGYRLTDAMCGFRAFRGSAMERIIPIFEQMASTNYIASEMWIKFAAGGITVAEIPIDLKGRSYGFSSKGLFRYGWGVFSAIVRAKLDTYKY